MRSRVKRRALTAATFSRNPGEHARLRRVQCSVARYAGNAIQLSEQLAEEIKQRGQALLGESTLSRGGRVLLGITGPPGAGKSTLAQALAEHLGSAAMVVPMDGFHLSNKQLALLGRSGRKGAPDTFDAAGYASLLQRLRRQTAGEVVYAPQFHREIEESIAAEIAVSPDIQVVITEGNYLLLDSGGWEAIRALLDEVWYLDVPQPERQRRLIERHQQFGRSAEAAERWVAVTDEPNARLIETMRERATLHLSL